MAFDNKDYYVNTANVLSYWNNINFYDLGSNNEIKTAFVGEHIQGIEEREGCVFIAKESVRMMPEPLIMNSKLFKLVRQRDIEVQPYCNWNEVKILQAPKTTVLTSNGKIVFPKMKVQDYIAPRITITPSAMRNGAVVTNRVQKLQFGKPTSLFLPNGVCASKENVRLKYGENESTGDEVLILKASSFKRKGEDVAASVRPAKRTVPNSALEQVLNTASDPMQTAQDILNSFKVPELVPEGSNFQFVYPNNPQWVRLSEFTSDIPTYLAQNKMNMLPYADTPGTVKLMDRVIRSGSVLTAEDIDDLMTPNQVSYLRRAGILKEM